MYLRSFMSLPRQGKGMRQRISHHALARHMTNPGLGKFILRTFLWMPPCFALWYFGAQPYSLLVGWFSRVMIDAFKPGIVTALERSAIDLVFVTSIKVHPAPGQTLLAAEAQG